VPRLEDASAAGGAIEITVAPDDELCGAATAIRAVEVHELGNNAVGRDFEDSPIPLGSAGSTRPVKAPIRPPRERRDEVAAEQAVGGEGDDIFERTAQSVAKDIARARDSAARRIPSEVTPYSLLSSPRVRPELGLHPSAPLKLVRVVMVPAPRSTRRVFPDHRDPHDRPRRRDCHPARR